jgi:hypothetical protein
MNYFKNFETCENRILPSAVTTKSDGREGHPARNISGAYFLCMLIPVGQGQGREIRY